MTFVHISTLIWLFFLFYTLAKAESEEEKLFGAVEEIFEPVSITALLGSCLFDEDAQWTKRDEQNFRNAIIGQLQIMCQGEGSVEYSFCNSQINISQVRIFFDSTSTKQQRMFWQTKLTLLYPDNPYASSHLISETAIFDKEVLSDVLAILSQQPNSSIPGWAIVDYERPVKIDPILEMINIYVLPVGVAIIAATLFIAWVGIRIGASTTEREMEAMREYKNWKRQRDFIERQKNSFRANFPMIQQHLSIENMTPPFVSPAQDQRRHLGQKATQAICASVANTAVKLTAGSLELDHKLRLRLDPDEAPNLSSPPSCSSISSLKKNVDGEGARKSRSRSPAVEFRRRATSAAPREKAVTVRTRFLLTPLSMIKPKPKADLRDRDPTHTYL